MTIFWVSMFAVFALGLLSRYTARPVWNGTFHYQPNRFFMILISLMLILVSGLRNGIGDTFFYMYSYSFQHITFQSIHFNITGEYGFALLQYALQHLNLNAQALIFVVALITNALIIPVLYKYSNLFELSILLYFTTGAYLESMNGIREFMAAAIIFAGTKYLLDGNWKKYMLFIFLASSIHQSALIFIPVCFIVRQKAWTKSTFILLGFTAVVILGFSEFSSLLYSALQDTKYGSYQNFEQHGANMLRAVVLAVPLLIAYIGRERLREQFPQSDYVVNLCMINLIIMLIATQQWIFARFSFYFELYDLILIPYIVKIFNYRSQRLVYYFITICYLGYYYYEDVVSLGIQYSSSILPH